MARFDVYAMAAGYLLDCQTDFLDGLETRLMVPLLAKEAAPRPAGRLNPTFQIAGKPVVMMTQYAAAIPAGELGRRIESLRHEQDAVTAAFDMLLNGF